MLSAWWCLCMWFANAECKLNTGVLHPLPRGRTSGACAQGSGEPEPVPWGRMKPRSRPLIVRSDLIVGDHQFPFFGYRNIGTRHFGFPFLHLFIFWLWSYRLVNYQFILIHVSKPYSQFSVSFCLIKYAGFFFIWAVPWVWYDHFQWNIFKDPSNSLVL
jgi:hypothetical protein